MINFVPQMHELSAFAYIDGGSGSLILQAAIAGFLGLAYTFKNFWRALLKPAKQESGNDRPNN